MFAKFFVARLLSLKALCLLGAANSVTLCHAARQLSLSMIKLSLSTLNFPGRLGNLAHWQLIFMTCYEKFMHRKRFLIEEATWKCLIRNF